MPDARQTENDVYFDEMRASLAITLAFLLPASALGASQASDLEKTIRAASRLEAIARFCPPLIPTDAARAREYGGAFIETIKRLNDERAAEMMPAEIKRRISEVEITGAQRWCEDQRRFMREIGAGDIFPEAPARRRR